MKFARSSRGPTTPIAPAAAQLDRRGLVVGAGVAAAAALAAAALHRQAVQTPVASAAKTAPPPADGYQETAHVLRYYQTARS